MNHNQGRPLSEHILMLKGHDHSDCNQIGTDVHYPPSFPNYNAHISPFYLASTIQPWKPEHMSLKMFAIVETLSLYLFAPSLVTLAVVAMSAREVVPVE